MLPSIATDQPLDPHEDSSPTCLILELVDPRRVFVGLLYSHGAIVAYRLRMSTLGCSRGLTFELSGRHRVGAWPAKRMMTLAGSRAKCQVGGGPLERRVRRHGVYSANFAAYLRFRSLTDMTCVILATTSSPNSDGAVTVTWTVNSRRSPDATTASHTSYSSLPCVQVKCA